MKERTNELIQSDHITTMESVNNHVLYFVQLKYVQQNE